jgi:hypothetical protein
LEIMPVAEPEQMVGLAAEHDILFGAQPGREPYTQLAIGNKVMAGIMAGLAIIMTDTVAHNRLLADNPGIGRLVRDENEQDIAQVLNSWFREKDKLLQVQETSWRAGTEKLNWDHESQRLVCEVDTLVARALSEPGPRDLSSCQAGKMLS